jgi:alkanesulfonate monooxygenase SsuD/methylene tetrahydromethanopterin reductase-like flavin-dependent oxidoreductase (luciferase family)
MTVEKPVQFSFFLNPQYQDLGYLRAEVAAADAGGLDFVAVQDHPYSPDTLDCLSVVGVLAGEFRRIRFISGVAHLPLRPPAMLARAAASLHQLTGGRFELGLGAGHNPEPDYALGGPLYTPKEAYEAYAESIGVLHAMWEPEGRPVRFDGDYYPLRGAHGGPPPGPGGPLRIWTGARGPRMVRLTGRVADGWWAPISTPFEAKWPGMKSIDEAAAKAGRDPKDIRRCLQFVGEITDRRTVAELPAEGNGAAPLRTDPEAWATIMSTAVRERGFDTFNIMLIGRDGPGQVERYATEVVPLVREMLG